MQLFSIREKLLDVTMELNLLNDAEEKSEQLIDLFCDIEKHKAKLRTYRRVALKNSLEAAQKKTKSKKEKRTAKKGSWFILNVI
jgi:hypothetical protein